MIELEDGHLSGQQVCCTWHRARGLLPMCALSRSLSLLLSLSLSPSVPSVVSKQAEVGTIRHFGERCVSPVIKHCLTTHPMTLSPIRRR